MLQLTHDPGEAPPEELARRAHAWYATRDPRALWPALDTAALQPMADAIGRAVPMLLRGDHATLACGDGEAYTFGVAALLTGTGPLLGWWAERGLLTSAPVRGVLARHLAHGRTRIERMAARLRPALERLAAAGIQPVIKGIHTALTYFPEPGTRPASDADIVVPPSDVSAVESALREAGFVPASIVHRPYKRDWFPPDDDARLHSLELFDARDRWKLEVHGGITFDGLRMPSLDLLSGVAATPRLGRAPSSQAAAARGACPRHRARGQSRRAGLDRGAYGCRARARVTARLSRPRTD